MKQIFVVISAVFCLAAVPAAAQQRDNQERQLRCQEGQQSRNNLAGSCEMREATVPFTGRLDVDGGANGGITVKGWSRGDVLVRSQVWAFAETDAQAKSMAGQIRVNTSGGQVRAEGPEMDRNQNWSVSYEVFVPQRADLSLKTHNGGIHVSDVSGKIEFEAVNGGVSLARLAGDVAGHTTNGGVKIELAGNRWDGQRLDVSTTNGGVTISVPENYSAHVETSTVNGGVSSDFGTAVRGKAGRNLSFDLGSGGGTIRATTTNGGVHIRRIG